MSSVNAKIKIRKCCDYRRKTLFRMSCTFVKNFDFGRDHICYNPVRSSICLFNRKVIIFICPKDSKRVLECYPVDYDAIKQLIREYNRNETLTNNTVDTGC